jgi:hypothetical protein
MTISAIFSLSRFCLLLGSFLIAGATSAQQQNKPDYYGAEVPGFSFSSGYFGASPDSAKLACESIMGRYNQRLAEASAGSYDLKSCTSGYAYAPDYTTNEYYGSPQISVSYDVKYYTGTTDYTNADGNTTTQVTQVTTREFCLPQVPWNAGVSCKCLSGYGQKAIAGYFDQGYTPLMRADVPGTFCLKKSAADIDGCSQKVTRYGPWYGSDKGVRHLYTGAVYKGTLDVCSAPEKPPLLEKIGADACPEGYAYRVVNGIEVCRPALGNTAPIVGTSGSCVQGDPCYFDPAKQPGGGDPANPPTTGGGGGTPPGGGTGGTGGTGSSLFDGICAIALIDKICAWFQPPNNALQAEGQSALDSAPVPLATQSLSMPNFNVSMATTTGCPAGLPMATPWGTIVAPFEFACDGASLLKPFIIIAALMMAMFIVFGRPS